MSNENNPSDVRQSGSGPRARPSSDSVPKARYGDGDVIAGRYSLGRRLGEGGMGEVWLAHDQTLDIDVAIKLIRAEDETTTERADRLLTEARAAARLGSPAIVRVNDFGKTDRGDPYIVMELLEGEDLAEALTRRGRLSPTKAVRTLLPIINALTIAHTKGIVHRDLKPENIYLAQNEDGQMQPKLVDFGVAKLEANNTGRLTQTGELMGSPLYMSPEQARGDDVDYRADVWSLGVVLYEVVTGAPPFEGKNYNAVLYSIIANPAPSIMDRGVDEPELWALISKAIDKDRDQRWYSMRDFGEALAHWLDERGITEDITGASIQTTWFNWTKDTGDQLGSAPPGPPSSGNAVVAADIPPPPLLPSRTREITIKTTRRAGLGAGALVAIGLAVTALVVAVVLSMREDSAVQPSSPQSNVQARSGNDTPAPGSVDPTGAEVTVTDEAAGEMTGVFIDEPALDPSKLPRAGETTAPNAAPAPRTVVRARRAAKPRSASTAPAPAPAPTAAPQYVRPKSKVSSSGIVTKDPY